MECYHEAKAWLTSLFALWTDVLDLNSWHKREQTLCINQKFQAISPVGYKSNVTPYNSRSADTPLRITWPPFSCIMKSKRSRHECFIFVGSGQITFLKKGLLVVFVILLLREGVLNALALAPPCGRIKKDTEADSSAHQYLR